MSAQNMVFYAVDNTNPCDGILKYGTGKFKTGRIPNAKSLTSFKRLVDVPTENLALFDSKTKAEQFADEECFPAVQWILHIWGEFAGIYFDRGGRRRNYDNSIDAYIDLGEFEDGEEPDLTLAEIRSYIQDIITALNCPWQVPDFGFEIVEIENLEDDSDIGYATWINNINGSIYDAEI